MILNIQKNRNVSAIQIADERKSMSQRSFITEILNFAFLNYTKAFAGRTEFLPTDVFAVKLSSEKDISLPRKEHMVNKVFILHVVAFGKETVDAQVTLAAEGETGRKRHFCLCREFFRRIADVGAIAVNYAANTEDNDCYRKRPNGNVIHNIIVLRLIIFFLHIMSKIYACQYAEELGAKYKKTVQRFEDILFFAFIML